MGEQTLEEEKATDQKVTSMAEAKVNRKAAEARGQLAG
jgi:ferritin-like metal-binding protein YciE